MTTSRSKSKDLTGMGNAANYASAGPTGWHTKLTYSKENQMPDDEASEIEEKQLKELKDL